MIKLKNFIKKLKVWQIALISIALATVIYMGVYFICAPNNSNNSEDISSLVLNDKKFKTNVEDLNNNDNSIYISETNYSLFPLADADKYFLNNEKNVYSIYGEIGIYYDYDGSQGSLLSYNEYIYPSLWTSGGIGLGFDIDFILSKNDVLNYSYDLNIINAYFGTNRVYFTFYYDYISILENSYIEFNIDVGSSITLDLTDCNFNILLKYDNLSQNAYTNGFNDGLNVGLDNASNDLQEAYNNGLSVGYQQGLHDGLNENSNQSLRNMLLTIFDVPLLYVKELLNFDLLGVNFLGLFGAIVTLGISLWILQKVL